jgi:hypothetical protein
MEFCNNCVKPGYAKNVYGETLCEECWEDYLFTDRGKVEYIISVVKEEIAITNLDADFLGHCAVQWYNNRGQFKIADEDILIIEEFAERTGIL